MSSGDGEVQGPHRHNAESRAGSALHPAPAQLCLSYASIFSGDSEGGEEKVQQDRRGSIAWSWMVARLVVVITVIISDVDL